MVGWDASLWPQTVCPDDGVCVWPGSVPACEASLLWHCPVPVGYKFAGGSVHPLVGEATAVQYLVSGSERALT